MANLALCRFVRNVSSVSRLVSKNNVFSKPYNPGALKKIESALPFSTRVPLRESSTSIIQCSRKATSQLPSISLQCRAMSSGGDHVRLWQLERIVAASFIALMPACIMMENPVVDTLFGLLVVMHAHWGLEAIVVDYVRPSVVGNILPKVAHATLYALSALTLVGLLALIYNGQGISKTVKKIWAIGGEPPSKGAH